MSRAVEIILEMARALTFEQRRELLAALERELLSIRGKFAHLPGSVDEFLARKRGDTEREL